MRYVAKTTAETVHCEMVMPYLKAGNDKS